MLANHGFPQEASRPASQLRLRRRTASGEIIIDDTDYHKLGMRYLRPSRTGRRRMAVLTQGGTKEDVKEGLTTATGTVRDVWTSSSPLTTDCMPHLCFSGLLPFFIMLICVSRLYLPRSEFDLCIRCLCVLLSRS